MKFVPVPDPTGEHVEGHMGNTVWQYGRGTMLKSPRSSLRKYDMAIRMVAEG